jgi:hypothetical protein
LPNDRQQVVEVVGDAAGQRAERFERVRLLQLLLELGAPPLIARPRADIPEAPHAAHHGAVDDLRLRVPFVLAAVGQCQRVEADRVWIAVDLVHAAPERRAVHHLPHDVRAELVESCVRAMTSGSARGTGTWL